MTTRCALRRTGGAPTAEEWLARAKRIGALGYDTLAMPEHMVGGQRAAMPALAALAPVTTKLRFGTLVVDNDLRNPVVFAREVAVLDVLCGGRFELGWARVGSIATTRERHPLRPRPGARRTPCGSDHADQASLHAGAGRFQRGRVTRSRTPRCRPRTIQQPHPPLMIAGSGTEILTLAGREANIVAIVRRRDHRDRQARGGRGHA